MQGSLIKKIRIKMWSTNQLSKLSCGIGLASVVQRLDSAFHRTNLYPVDIAIIVRYSYPLDSDLSGG